MVCPVPSHYLKQYRNVVNWCWEQMSMKFESNITILIKKDLLKCWQNATHFVLVPMYYEFIFPGQFLLVSLTFYLPGVTRHAISFYQHCHCVSHYMEYHVALDHICEIPILLSGKRKPHLWHKFIRDFSMMPLYWKVCCGINPIIGVRE